MAWKQTDAVSIGWQREILNGIAQALLLVPEALLIALLLCVYWATSEPPLVGMIVTLLIISFLTRLLALVGARRSFNNARYREADTLAQIGLALYPWSADALALQGTIALALGRATAAEPMQRQAIALLPGRASIYAALSSALLALGRPAEAAEAARLALSLEPQSAIIHFYLAEAEQAAGVPTLEVEDRLRAGLALATTPEDEAALRCALGALLISEERTAEAMLTLRGAEALMPNCRPAHQLELRVRLGELMIAQGQIERAREQFRNVAALDASGRYAGATWRATHLL
jgi:tetratricopeptide (TPR) repeat protein